MEILIYSLGEMQKAARKPFDKYTALISIGDAFAEPLRLDHWPEYFLELHFDDVWSSELEYETSGADAFRLFSGEQAAQIAAFLRSHLEEIDTLICQCRSGRSRSAAVAAAVREYFSHNGIEIFKDEHYSPNVYVFQKTLRALEENFNG